MGTSFIDNYFIYLGGMKKEFADLENISKNIYENETSNLGFENECKDIYIIYEF